MKLYFQIGRNGTNFTAAQIALVAGIVPLNTVKYTNGSEKILYLTVSNDMI